MMWSASMKINPDIKYSQLSQEFKEHLRFIKPNEMVLSVWIFLVGLYNVPLFVSLLRLAKLDFLGLLWPLLLACRFGAFLCPLKIQSLPNLRTVCFLGFL